MARLNKKVELLKLEYDKFKSYTFYSMAASISLTIAYNSTKELIFGIAAIVLYLPFLLSMWKMEESHEKLRVLLRE